jgi:hypothetical protein
MTGQNNKKLNHESKRQNISAAKKQYNVVLKSFGCFFCKRQNWTICKFFASKTYLDKLSSKKWKQFPYFFFNVKAFQRKNMRQFRKHFCPIKLFGKKKFTSSRWNDDGREGGGVLNRTANLHVKHVFWLVRVRLLDPKI